MAPLATWEMVLAGVLALLVVLWFWPGARTMIEQSKHAERNWPAVLIPLILVILFVIVLIALV